MKSGKQPDCNGPSRLSELNEICRAAGAALSTVIHSDGKVVVFYKDSQAGDFCLPDSYDELHIRSETNVSILIAVFQEAIPLPNE